MQSPWHKYLLSYFVTQIAKIRTLLAALEISIDVMLCPPVESLLTPCTSKLLCFRPTDALEITEIVTKPSKATGILDPIPTNLLHDLLPVLAPVIADLVNSSLATGVFPSELKSAIIDPLLKKPGLDTDVLKKFHPVSNLLFISKVIKKVVASRLLDHMVENKLLRSFQSAYMAGHSTETALLRVHHDIVNDFDQKKGVFFYCLTSRWHLILWTMICFLTFLEIILVSMVLSWIYLDHIWLVELSVFLSLESCQN